MSSMNYEVVSSSKYYKHVDYCSCWGIFFLAYNLLSRHWITVIIIEIVLLLYIILYWILVNFESVILWLLWVFSTLPRTLYPPLRQNNPNSTRPIVLPNVSRWILECSSIQLKHIVTRFFQAHSEAYAKYFCFFQQYGLICFCYRRNTYILWGWSFQFRGQACYPSLAFINTKIMKNNSLCTNVCF